MSDNNKFKTYYTELSSGIAWSIFCSFASIIMSIIALAKCAPSSQLHADYIGAIVGILALLVTVLVGWQIFSLVKLDRLKNNLEKAENKIAEAKRDAQKELYAQTSLMYSIHSKSQLAKFDLDAVSKDYDAVSFAYSLAVSALRFSLEAETNKIVDGCLGTLAVCIRIAAVFDKWDIIFPKATTDLADDAYYSILPFTKILTSEQSDRLILIHNCRKNKEMHQSLRNV